MSSSSHSREEKSDDQRNGSNLEEGSPEKAETNPRTPRKARWDPWLRVLATFLVYVSTWGLLNAVGSYQNYYSTVLLPDESNSNLTWVGTLQAVLIILIGVVSGPLFDRGYIRTLLITGCFLVVFGMMMTSLGTQFYQIVLAQGLCVGLGGGMIYVPCLALVGSSFSAKNRVVAIAVATSGAAVGGVVFPVALQNLIPEVGFPWATRIIGFIAMFCFVVALIIVLPRTPKPPPQARSLIDWTAFREPAFMFFCFSLFFIFIAYYVPFFFTPDFGAEKVHASADFSVYLLTMMNAATAPGRIIAALLATRFGSLEIFLASLFGCTIVLWGWFGVTSLAGFDVWVVVFGFFAGPLVTVPAAVAAEVCPSVEMYGTRLGMAWAFAALGGLVGAPTAGALIKGASFYKAQAFVGVMMTTGLVLLILMWLSLRKNHKS